MLCKNEPLVIDMQSKAINYNEFQKFTIKYSQKNVNLQTKEKQLQTIALINAYQPQYQKAKPKIDRDLKSKHRSLAGSETARYSRDKPIESLRSKSISVRQKTRTVNDLKDIKKVPIQFSDETPWAGLKGRIVYKGHTPKNSYYLLANLIQCQEDDPPDQDIRNAYEYDLQFNSKFESGNLQAALRVTKHQYWLFMREDTNSLGLRQWFFFEVVCNRPLAVSFRIYKFNKKHSLYRRGMKPYIKQMGQDWIQKGSNVRYEYDAQLKCFYLQFSYEFAKERTKIAVAAMPPYTYSRLTRYLSSLNHNPLIKISTIGRSLGGIQIPLIELAFAEQGLKKGQESKRRAIVIMGRTHPAQTCSNFSIEVIVTNLVASLQLRQSFDFFIIPMVNPDGVVVGNHRTSLTGVDLNRKFTFNFKTTDKELYPEVEGVKLFIKDLQRTHRIESLIDLHGHSAKKNIFAYGQEEEIGSNNYLKSRVIPKLLSQLLASFRYDHCVFQSYKQKQSTARVYFGKKYRFNTLTFEQSYGLIGKAPISIADWRSFGQALVSVMIHYQAVYMEDNLAMTQKLADEIECDQEKKKKAREKQENLTKNSNDAIQRESSLFLSEKIEIRTKENQKAKSLDEVDEDLSGSASELESGDEDLENTDQGLQQLRAKLYAPSQTYDRQSLPLPDTSIQLQQFTKPRMGILHEHKMPMISRIMKMREKSKKSSQLIDILTRKTAKEESQSVRLRIRQHKIKLPNIDRFLV